MRSESEEAKSCNAPVQESNDLESLEYEEDAYYAKLAPTPSFDEEAEDDDIEIHCWRDLASDMDEILVICDDQDLFGQDEEGKPMLQDEKKRQRILARIEPYLKKIGIRGDPRNVFKFVKRREGSAIGREFFHERAGESRCWRKGLCSVEGGDTLRD